MTLAGDAVHYSDYVFCGCVFCYADVPISTEDESVVLPFNDSVEYVVAGSGERQYCSSFLQLRVLVRTYGYLVIEMPDEWIHAVAFGSNTDSLAFGNQCLDLLHHHFLSYD